jgi:Carboxypeptidase regulatory-like domain/TonB-dependent Receptor Plug Domain/TonB dependent receptor
MIPRIRLRIFVYVVSAAIALLLTNAVPSRAQVAGATLTGTITDSSGGDVPHAQVVIKDVSTGVERTVTTNKDGFYIAANLLPAEYQVTVSAPGFNTEIKNGIKLNVGMEQEFNLVLQVGTVTHRVEVTAEAPAVQLATSDISATVQATTVRELPLNGRSWTDLAALQPGVDTIQTQPSFSSGADRGNRGFGQQLTISGARPQQNNYRLDGVSLNDYANGAPGSVLGGSLGVDAIQEFSVLTSNYSAEYGKTSGGVVNAITRSGTAAFHGSAYEFLRNSALDARNFFDGPQIPSFKRNQFGGSIGGPIIRERTFFFFDYEGIRQSKGITAVTTVPSLDARNGMIHDSDGNPITVTIDPNVQKALAFYHLPNGPVTDNPDIAQYRFSGQQVVNENFYTTRLDHKISEKDSMSGTYLFDKTPYTSPDGVNAVLLTTKSSRQIAVLEETHIFKPSFANSVRFGYNYENVDNNQGLKALVPAAGDTSLGTFPGRTAPQIFVSGLTTFLGGVGGESAYFYHWNTFQLYDDAFVNKGTHTIKFGFAAERMELEIKALSDPNGIFHFNNLQTFYANNPSRFQGGIASTLSPRNLRQTLVGGYIQDDWRFKPNLTLNLGLRYEMVTVPTETAGKLSVLRNLSDATPHLGDPFFNNPTTKNFEPRVGFAWDPFRNGKMAVRGGFGMFDVLPLPYQFTLLTTLAAPFFQYTSINNPGAGSYPNNLPPLPSNKLRATYIDPNPKRNYVMQYNLNIQYQLTPSLTSLVAYVGSRGIHQPYRPDDADIVLPTLTSAGYLFPKVDALGNLFSPTCNQLDPGGSDPDTCAPPNRINENYGSVRGMFYEGQSYYNALEAQLAKRMSHGFQVQGTFTWGRSIDTSSATVAGDAFGNSIASPSFFFNPRASRAVSDFNVARTLVINGLWELPSPKSITGPARFLTEGWQLGLIFTASTGIPFTATFGTGGDPNGTLSSDDWAYPNRLGGSGCQSLTNSGNPNNYIKTQCFAVPVAPSQAFFDANCDPAPPSLGAALAPGDLRCFNLKGNSGRNVAISPGLIDVDFSVFKNNYIRKISETFNIQFRAEMFNVFNHANFAPPVTPDNTDIFDATGAPTGVAGLLTRTTTTAREIQFALKVIF